MYYTAKSGEKYFYETKPELQRLQHLDWDWQNEGISKWETCDFVIPYLDQAGKRKYFAPHFLVTLSDGSKRVEYVVSTYSAGDLAQLKAGDTFAREKGWKFRLVQGSLQTPTVEYKSDTYENDYGFFQRPTEESIFVQAVVGIAQRSTCLRKRVGALFTDAKMRQVYCFGYNGGIAGGPNQCDTLEEGNCGCVHAEVNALTKSVVSLEGATCFVSLSPCETCAKLLVNRGIQRVVYVEEYRTLRGVEILERYNVKTEKF